MSGVLPAIPVAKDLRDCGQGVPAREVGGGTTGGEKTPGTASCDVWYEITYPQRRGDVSLCRRDHRVLVR